MQLAHFILPRGTMSHWTGLRAYGPGNNEIHVIVLLIIATAEGMDLNDMYWVQSCNQS